MHQQAFCPCMHTRLATPAAAPTQTRLARSVLHSPFHRIPALLPPRETTASVRRAPHRAARGSQAAEGFQPASEPLGLFCGLMVLVREPGGPAWACSCTYACGAIVQEASQPRQAPSGPSDTRICERRDCGARLQAAAMASGRGASHAALSAGRLTPLQARQVVKVASKPPVQLPF